MNRLKQERERKGLSLRELQKEILNKYGLNLGSASLSNYERGMQEPKKETWETLANFFDVSTAYLMGLEPYRNDDERQSAFSRFFYVDEIMGITEEPTPFGESARVLFEIFSEILLRLDTMVNDHERVFLARCFIDIFAQLHNLMMCIDLSIINDDDYDPGEIIIDSLRMKREIDETIDVLLAKIVDNVLE